MNDDDRQALAARVRNACIDAAVAGYEDAAIAGLCGEGALEVAIDAIRQLDLDPLISTPSQDAGGTGTD